MENRKCLFWSYMTFENSVDRSWTIYIDFFKFTIIWFEVVF